MSSNPVGSKRSISVCISQDGLDRLYFALDFGLFPVTGDLQVVTGLQVEPKFRESSEKSAQTQRRIGGDGPALMQNFSYSRHRHAQIKRQTVHAQAERFHKLFPKNFSRMNRLQFCSHLITRNS